MRSFLPLLCWESYDLISRQTTNSRPFPTLSALLISSWGRLVPPTRPLVWGGFPVWKQLSLDSSSGGPLGATVATVPLFAGHANGTCAGLARGSPGPHRLARDLPPPPTIGSISYPLLFPTVLSFSRPAGSPIDLPLPRVALVVIDPFRCYLSGWSTNRSLLDSSLPFFLLKHF